MSERKGGVCAAMIGKDSKMMVVGGYGSDSVELFDFDENKHIQNMAELNTPRGDAGICYDRVKEAVYVGGGSL